MRTSIILALVFIVALGGGLSFLVMEDSSNQESFADTDDDGIVDVNDTFIFDPQCSEDTDSDGVCDALEAEFDGGSDQALNAKVSTSKDTYGYNEEFDIEMDLENNANIAAENLDYRIATTQQISDPRPQSRIQQSLDSGETASALWTSEYGGETDPNYSYSGTIEVQAAADYTTESFTSLKFLTREQMRNQAAATGFDIETANRGGPVVARIRHSDPKLVQLSENTIQFDLIWTLTDLAEGQVAEIGEESAVVEATVNFPNAPSGSPKTECTRDVELSVGRGTFTCNFELNGSVTGERLRINSELSYPYRSEDDEIINFEE